MQSLSYGYLNRALAEMMDISDKLLEYPWILYKRKFSIYFFQNSENIILNNVSELLKKNVENIIFFFFNVPYCNFDGRKI